MLFVWTLVWVSSKGSRQCNGQHWPYYWRRNKVTGAFGEHIFLRSFWFQCRSFLLVSHFYWLWRNFSLHLKILHLSGNRLNILLATRRKNSKMSFVKNNQNQKTLLIPKKIMYIYEAIIPRNANLCGRLWSCYLVAQKPHNSVALITSLYKNNTLWWFI